MKVFRQALLLFLLFSLLSSMVVPLVSSPKVFFATLFGAKGAVIDTSGSTRFFRLFVGYNYNDLHFSEQDAALMYTAVTSWPSKPGGNNTIMTQITPWQPTQANIFSWFTEIAGQAGAGDVVVFYFNGHGNANEIGVMGDDDQITKREFVDNIIQPFDNKGVAFSIILDVCDANLFLMYLRASLIKRNIHVELAALGTVDLSPDATWGLFTGWQPNSYTYRRLVNGPSPAFGNDGTGHTRGDTSKNGVTTLLELSEYTSRSPWGFKGDDDGDGRVDEDDVDLTYDQYGHPVYAYIDNDGDGSIDEDPAPKYVELITTFPMYSSGGYGSISVSRFPRSDYEMFGPRVDYVSASYRGDPTGTFDALDNHQIDIIDSPIYDSYLTQWSGRTDIIMQDSGSYHGPKAYSLYDENGPGVGNEWQGIVNQRVFGVNSWWTFMDAHTANNPDGGTIRYGLSTTDADSMNPLYARSYHDWELLGKVYDSLFAIDPNDPAALGPPGIKPWVAQSFSYTLENDPQQGNALVTTIEFFLRNDVYFHDGVRLNASDVEFTLKTMVDTLWLRGLPDPWWVNNILEINRIDVIDEFTFKVWMIPPEDYEELLYPTYLRDLGLMVILPKHIWEPIVTAGDPTTFSPDPQLVGSGPFRVYPKNVIVGDPNGVYVPGTSFLLKAYKPQLGYAAGPNEDMIDPEFGNYIGYFRYSPIQVEDPVQTLNDQGGVQEYVILYNYGTTPAVNVRVRVWLNIQQPASLLYDSGATITIPAATGGGAYSGKYLLAGITTGANGGTLIVRVTPAAGVETGVTGAFVSSASIPGDVTTSGNTALDRVNVFDAILLSTAWGGALGPSTSSIITGPWKQPNGDFNDDNTINAADGAWLGLNYGY